MERGGKNRFGFGKARRGGEGFFGVSGGRKKRKRCGELRRRGDCEKRKRGGEAREEGRGETYWS